MPVITITGLIGSGAPELGTEVSRKLGTDYVDRLILAEAARKMGTTVAAVAERTERTRRFGDRVAGFVRTVLERSALAGGGADPYFGGGLDALLVREYRNFPPENQEERQEGALTDSRLLEITSSVIREIAQTGNVVIAGRGANIILRDQPGVLHVGLVSSLEERIKRIMEREDLSREEAEHFVAENDRARQAYFRRFFRVEAQDARHYHMVLNTDWLKIPCATDVVIAAGELVA